MKSGATINPSWGRLLCQGEGKRVSLLVLSCCVRTIVDWKANGYSSRTSWSYGYLHLPNGAVWHPRAGCFVPSHYPGKHGSSVVYWWKYSDPDAVKQLPKMPLVGKTAEIRALASGLLKGPRQDPAFFPTQEAVSCSCPLAQSEMEPEKNGQSLLDAAF